jgi:hypothetical protein
MWTVDFWKAAGERAVKTAAQAAIALFAAGVTILDIDWAQGGAVVATATLLSVLSSVASYGVGPFEGPSLTDESLMHGIDWDDEL